MEKQKWSFKIHTYSLADTGDYEGYIQFTNGKDILQTCGDEIEEEQLQQFCDLLDCMPDLWSHKNDANEFELSQLKRKSEYFEKALKIIRDGVYTDGETDKDDLTTNADVGKEVPAHEKNLLSPVASIEQIEEVARQYFEVKYPLMDLTTDEDKCEIDWWDMLQFVQHVLSCHCR